MVKTYQIQARFPPVYYYPNEFTIVTNSIKFKQPFLDKVFYTTIKGCYICHCDSDCVHHIISIIELGNNNNKNLMPLCFKHHQEIHNTDNINIPIPIGINKALIKKTHKLLRKFWIKNPEGLWLHQDPDFIYIHLIIDDTIKYLIKHNYLNRLYEFIESIYNNGTIKHKPNIRRN